VIIVHGIDYNGNGIYDNVLERSDLSPALTGESTAPALCGMVVAAQNAKAAYSGATGDATVYTASLIVNDEISPTGQIPFLCPLFADEPGRRASA
jgi:hypothetical protein